MHIGVAKSRRIGITTCNIYIIYPSIQYAKIEFKMTMLIQLLNFEEEDKMVKNVSLHISWGSFVFSAREKTKEKG